MCFSDLIFNYFYLLCEEVVKVRYLDRYYLKNKLGFGKNYFGVKEVSMNIVFFWGFFSSFFILHIYKYIYIMMTQEMEVSKFHEEEFFFWEFFYVAKKVGR